MTDTTPNGTSKPAVAAYKRRKVESGICRDCSTVALPGKRHCQEHQPKPIRTASIRHRIYRETLYFFECRICDPKVRGFGNVMWADAKAELDRHMQQIHATGGKAKT